MKESVVCVRSCVSVVSVPGQSEDSRAHLGKSALTGRPRHLA